MTTTHYFWDPVEDNVVQERDETGSLDAEYTTEPRLYGNIISQERLGVEGQFHFDALGSTLALTEGKQQVGDIWAYSAFGEMMEREGLTETPFQYIGQKGYHSNRITRQYSIRFRCYTPGDVRWMSVDPLLISAPARYRFTPASYYAYAHNCPLRYKDPSGLVVLERTDPHTGQRKQLAAGDCRSKVERDRDQFLIRNPPVPPHYKPSCPIEECQSRISTVSSGKRVAGCFAALDDFGAGRNCTDIGITCDPKCQYVALYYPTTHSISICVDRLPTLSDEQLEDYLCHELLHARQSKTCRPQSDNPYHTRDQCQNSLRKELQAYFCTTSCEWFWECFTRALRSACPDNCDPAGTPPQPTQRQIDDLYSWANPHVQDNGNFCPAEARRR